MKRKATKAAIKVMKAYVAGKTIEFRPRSAHGPRPWETMFEKDSPLWDWDGVEYRVQPDADEEVVTKPSIDWAAVQPIYQYLSTDSSGLSYLYREEPDHGTTNWYGAAVSAEPFVSFTKGTCAWQDSLVKRGEF